MRTLSVLIAFFSSLLVLTSGLDAGAHATVRIEQRPVAPELMETAAATEKKGDHKKDGGSDSSDEDLAPTVDDRQALRALDPALLISSP